MVFKRDGKTNGKCTCKRDRANEYFVNDWKSIAIRSVSFRCLIGRGNGNWAWATRMTFAERPLRCARRLSGRASVVDSCVFKHFLLCFWFELNFYMWRTVFTNREGSCTDPIKWNCDIDIIYGGFWLSTTVTKKKCFSQPSLHATVRLFNLKKSALPNWILLLYLL